MFLQYIVEKQRVVSHHILDRVIQQNLRTTFDDSENKEECKRLSPNEAVLKEMPFPFDEWLILADWHALETKVEKGFCVVDARELIEGLNDREKPSEMSAFESPDELFCIVIGIVLGFGHQVLIHESSLMLDIQVIAVWRSQVKFLYNTLDVQSLVHPMKGGKTQGMDALSLQKLLVCYCIL